MYAYVDEEYDYIDSNIVGDAIIADMMGQLNVALDVLEKYQVRSSEVSDKKADEVEALTKLGPVKKFFWKLRSLFLSDAQIFQELWAKPEEIKEINSYLAKYRELDDKLFSYNLKDNVSESIVSYIKQMKCDDELTQMLIEEQISPTLNKLGFGNLISDIEKEFQPEKKQSPVANKKSWEMSNWEIDEEEFRKVTADICFENSKKQTKKNNATNELSEK